MDLGAFWKNKEGNGYNGRLVLDCDVVLKADIAYEMFLNEVNKNGNDKAPDYRLSVKHFVK